MLETFLISLLVATSSVSAPLPHAISAPRDLDTCFSPDEACGEKLLAFVQSARRSVDVAVFAITLEDLVDELVDASMRIQVRVIVDARQAQTENSLVYRLIRGKVDVRYGRQRGLMHDKFSIVDDAMVQTGSFNYTTYASEASAENQVYLASPVVVKRYKAHFDEMWDRARPASRRPAESSQ